MTVDDKVNRPVVLTVAGSDSAGLAGMQTDLRVQSALGSHSACAVTANTAQDGRGLLALDAVPPDSLLRQLQAAAGLAPAVVKAGMLASADQVAVLCDFLDSYPLPLVLDPVLRSTSGHALGEEGLPRALLARLLRRCTLLTPNLEEAVRLGGAKANSLEETEQLARRLMEKGARAVLIKGGHRGGIWSQDYFCSPERAFWLSSPAQPLGARGTGCALASAIAASLALGHPLADAVVVGKMAINQGLRQAYACGDGHRAVHVTAFPGSFEDFPLLHEQASPNPAPPPFPDCGPRPLGLYPVVERVGWLKRLLPLGISTVQLRIKDLDGNALEAEVAEASRLARAAGARLFINDHWRLAIEHGAYGVHLGQQDLAGADIEAIRRAGLRLGVSTHCHHEAAAAHALNPSYIACGPVFHTDTKKMPWIPHGLEGLRYWKNLLSGYPLVAIGGIKRDSIADVAGVGVDGVALITAITRARDPEESARELLSLLSRAGRP